MAKPKPIHIRICKPDIEGTAKTLGVSKKTRKALAEAARAVYEPKAPVSYWAMWGLNVCSKHRTLKTAMRAAKKCERAGGEPHPIYKVQRVI